MCNQHPSSQWIPSLSRLLPWGMQHTWLQYSFYKSSSERFYSPVLLIYFFCCEICWVSTVSKVHQKINVKSLAGKILTHFKFLTWYLIYLTFIIRSLVTYVIRLCYCIRKLNTDKRVLYMINIWSDCHITAEQKPVSRFKELHYGRTWNTLAPFHRQCRNTDSGPIHGYIKFM